MRFITVVLFSFLLTGCGTAIEEKTDVKGISSKQENIEVVKGIEKQNKSVKQPETKLPNQEQTVLALPSDTLQAEDEESYFDEEFLQAIKQGYLKGMDINVEDTVGLVRQKYGENFEVGAGEGSYFLSYDEVRFHYQARVPYEDRKDAVDNNEQLTAIDLFVKDALFFTDMKEGLGEPDSSFMGLDDHFMFVYHFGNYELWVETIGSKEDQIQYLRLKRLF